MYTKLIFHCFQATSIEGRVNDSRPNDILDGGAGPNQENATVSISSRAVFSHRKLDF